MKKNRKDEVFEKMVFLQDDINIKFLEIIISSNTKSFIDFQLERELIYSQILMIIKCLNSGNDEMIKSGVEMFFCKSDISGLSVNNIYNIICEYKKTKTDDEIKEFLESLPNANIFVLQLLEDTNEFKKFIANKKNDSMTGNLFEDL